jgi:hypothetical protein
MTYCGTPGAQGFMGGLEFLRTVTFAVDWDGSSGSVGTNPASDYVVSIQKDGVEVGTVTFDVSGTPTFATTGGATVSCGSGNVLSFVGPASVGAAADFTITLLGAL